MPEVESITLHYTDGTKRTVPIAPRDPDYKQTQVPLTVVDTKSVEEVKAVYTHWLEATKRSTTRTKLTKERRDKIKARLKTYTVDELNQAIDFYATDPFHSGDNDSGKRYDDIVTILRNDTKVATGLEAEAPSSGRDRYRIG